MAEAKSPDEPTLPAKRKPDLTPEDEEALPLKSQKLQLEDDKIHPKKGKHSDISVPETIPENEELRIGAEEEDDDVDDDYEDDDEEDDDHDEENGNVVVDRKGKGILLEEEKDSDDEEDDDSGDEGNETEGESDLSDDPLAEVDLNNILPSRTRRLAVQPGVYIAKDAGSNGEGDESDESD